MSKHPIIKKADCKKGIKDKRIDRELEILELAGKCLTNDDFVAYEKRYSLIRNEMMGAILNYSETDPVKYAFAIQSLINRYKLVSMLFNNVNEKAKIKDK